MPEPHTVPIGRRRARRQAVFVLYQQDLLGISVDAALERLREEDVSEYGRQIVLGAARDRERIDELIGSRLSGWQLDRLGNVERAILRVAAYELLEEPETPGAVVIDQAVELAKRFCSDEAGALVNGVLGSLAQEAGMATEDDGVNVEGQS